MEGQSSPSSPALAPSCSQQSRGGACSCVCYWKGMTGDQDASSQTLGRLQEAKRKLTVAVAKDPERPLARYSSANDLETHLEDAPLGLRLESQHLLS